MAFEEGRHKEVLSHLVRAYGIELEPEPEYVGAEGPRMGVHGHGLQRVYRQLLRLRPVRTGPTAPAIFPPELVETFEPVIQEEGRHILFFTNWIASHRRTMPSWRRPWFFFKTLAVWAYLIRERIGLARDVSAGDKENANFTMEGAGPWEARRFF